MLRNLIYCNTWKILLTIRGPISMSYIFSFALMIGVELYGSSGRMLE